jgi:hypothetical protein
MTADTAAAPIEFDGLVKRFGDRTVLPAVGGDLK